MPTKITFYGGVNEVGGNKILLSDKDAAVLLDFAKGFSRRAKYFEEYLSPRTANAIIDFMEIRLVPDIEGICREDLLEKAGGKAIPPAVQAVLLSHAHADHADYVSFLHRDIPLYMGATCQTILQAIQERALSDFEREVLDFIERPAKRGIAESLRVGLPGRGVNSSHASLLLIWLLSLDNDVIHGLLEFSGSTISNTPSFSSECMETIFK